MEYTQYWPYGAASMGNPAQIATTAIMPTALPQNQLFYSSHGQISAGYGAGPTAMGMAQIPYLPPVLDSSPYFILPTVPEETALTNLLPPMATQMPALSGLEGLVNQTQQLTTCEVPPLQTSHIQTTLPVQQSYTIQPPESQQYQPPPIYSQQIQHQTTLPLQTIIEQPQAQSEPAAPEQQPSPYPNNLIEILAQVSEDQFSDAHLQRQQYVLRQIVRTQHRWISTKFFASLKHIRRLSKGDWKLVVEALRMSDKLEVNEEGTKVRRKLEIPEKLVRLVDKQKKISSVLAVNVPKAVATVDGIQDVFGRYGKIQQMRIVQPYNRVPNYLRGYATQIPELGKVTCAIVEFDTEESARRAQQSTNKSTTHNITAMRVALLGPKIKRNLSGNISNLSSPTASSIISDPDSVLSNVDSGIFSNNRRNRVLQLQQSRLSEGRAGQSSTSIQRPVRQSSLAMTATNR